MFYLLLFYLLLFCLALPLLRLALLCGTESVVAVRLLLLLTDVAGSCVRDERQGVHARRLWVRKQRAYHVWTE